MGEVVLQLAKSYLENLNDMVHNTKETRLRKEEVHVNSQVKERAMEVHLNVETRKIKKNTKC